MAFPIDDFRQLPVTEKLRIVEALWDDISKSNERFPLPDWHRQLCEQRDAELDADPSTALTRDELWQRVRTLRRA